MTRMRRRIAWRRGTFFGACVGGEEEEVYGIGLAGRCPSGVAGYGGGRWRRKVTKRHHHPRTPDPRPRKTWGHEKQRHILSLYPMVALSRPFSYVLSSPFLPLGLAPAGGLPSAVRNNRSRKKTLHENPRACSLGHPKPHTQLTNPNMHWSGRKAWSWCTFGCACGCACSLTHTHQDKGTCRSVGRRKLR